MTGCNTDNVEYKMIGLLRTSIAFYALIKDPFFYLTYRISVASVTMISTKPCITVESEPVLLCTIVYD